MVAKVCCREKAEKKNLVREFHLILLLLFLWDGSVDFGSRLLGVISGASLFHARIIAAVLWGLWNYRNNKLWKTVSSSAAQVVKSRMDYAETWLAAKMKREMRIGQMPHVSRWSKPPSGWLKCNVDVYCGRGAQAVGVGMVALSSNGRMVLCCSQTIQACCCSKEAEALACMGAITWLFSMQMSNVIIELNVKGVVEAIKSGRVN